MKRVTRLLILQLAMLIYSLNTLFAKRASLETFFSLRFMIFYSAGIFCLALYAVIWQQILKNVPLNIAYANKAATVIWGMLWGKFLFGEYLSVSKICGAILIIAGVFIISKSITSEVETADGN